MTTNSEKRKRRFSIHTRILLGFVVGAIVGLAVNQLVRWGSVSSAALEGFIGNVTAPVGQIFLNLLFLVVVPIVFCTIALGVAQLGNVNQLGRFSSRTLFYFLLTNAAASLLGLVLALAVRPGAGFDPGVQEQLIETYRPRASETQSIAEQEEFWPDVIVGVVSRNPLSDAVDSNMLAVIFTAIVFGLALTRLPEDKSRPVMAVLDGIASASVVIVGFAMAIAPIAVPALIFDVAAQFGWEIFRQLSVFVVVVLAGYVVHLFFSNAVFLRVLAQRSPSEFFRKMIPVMVTALSTSSSSATLPTTLKVSEEELGLPRRLAGFVLPLGATINMNGTALFVTVVVMFLAQVFSVPLTVSQLLMVIMFAVLTAVGAAGVPSGSLPIIVVVLTQLGIPGEGLALILGVERILDMGRTVVNVTGDAAAACFVGAEKGVVLEEAEAYAEPPGASAVPVAATVRQSRDE